MVTKNETVYIEGSSMHDSKKCRCEFCIEDAKKKASNEIHDSKDLIRGFLAGRFHIWQANKILSIADKDTVGTYHIVVASDVDFFLDSWYCMDNIFVSKNSILMDVEIEGREFSLFIKFDKEVA